MEDGRKKEYQLKISNANRVGLVVIVYDICMDYLDEAIGYAGSGETAEFRKALANARSCITRHMSSLDMTQDLSETLMQIYIFCIRQLARADYKVDVDRVQSVRVIMERLRDAFRTIEDQDTSSPVMDHTHEVYAGLTYGTGGLNESIVSGENRGYRV